MNPLEKVIERGSDGELGRVAYAFGKVNLPKAAPGFEWQAVSFFQRRPRWEIGQLGSLVKICIQANSATSSLKNAGLNEVFRAAIVNGCVVVKPS
jgi:hypothetical protein